LKARPAEFGKLVRILKLCLNEKALPAPVVFARETGNSPLIGGCVVSQFADSGLNAAKKALADHQSFVCHDVNLWGRLKFCSVMPMINRALRRR
jgi:hypothetical protein